VLSGVRPSSFLACIEGSDGYRKHCHIYLLFPIHPQKSIADHACSPLGDEGVRIADSQVPSKKLSIPTSAIDFAYDVPVTENRSVLRLVHTLIFDILQKGKLVDAHSARAKICARACGGHNAGHSIV
jgi:Adenylosuccinate synthetase